MEPRPFKTALVDDVVTALDALPPESLFGSFAQEVAGAATTVSRGAADPDVLAVAVVKAATAKRPRPRYRVRVDLLRTLLGFLPASVLDLLIRMRLASLDAIFSQAALRSSPTAVEAELTPTVA